MKRYILQWKWIAAIMLSLFVNAYQGVQATPPINDWTVFVDSFTDCTTSVVAAPYHPYWEATNATNSTVFVAQDTVANSYHISSCLGVASWSASQEVVTVHRNQLANYSFMYFTRIQPGGAWSESLFRFNRDTIGNENGYSLSLSEIGQFKVQKVINNSWTTLTSFSYSTASIGSPHQWTYVKVDISGSSFIIYLNNYTMATINDSSISSGGVGFRAVYFGALYYYARIDVSYQGQWKMLYGHFSVNTVLNTQWWDVRYIDPTNDTTGGNGTLFLSGTTLQQYSEYSNRYIHSVAATVDGSTVLYGLATNLFYTSNDIIAASNYSSSSVADLFRWDSGWQEFGAVGIDDYAYFMSTYNPNNPPYYGSELFDIDKVYIAGSGLGETGSVRTTQVYSVRTAISTHFYPIGGNLSPDGGRIAFGRIRNYNPNVTYLLPEAGTTTGVSVLYDIAMMTPDNAYWAIFAYNSMTAVVQTWAYSTTTTFSGMTIYIQVPPPPPGQFAPDFFDVEGAMQPNIIMLGISSTTTYTVSTNGWCGYAGGGQPWDWDLYNHGFWTEEYGRYNPDTTVGEGLRTLMYHIDPVNATYSVYSDIHNGQVPPVPYHGYWHWPTDDPRWSSTSTFWASYQEQYPHFNNYGGSISGLFYINTATGIAKNLTPFLYYSDNGTSWWNMPSD